MRIKESLDAGWKYIIGEIGPFPKTCKKSGLIGGLTNSIAGENGEPFAGAKRALQRLQDVLPVADNADTNMDVSVLLMGECPPSGRSLEGWKTVDLPHDFRLEMGYDDNSWGQGSIPNGVCYYRKTFKVPKSDEGKRIVLEFDGVMRAASFWYNGCFLGDHYSGYTGFQFDVTELTKYGDDEGDNVLLVRCDTTTGDEGWWYEGGGIYLHTWLTKYEPVHVDRWGVYVRSEVEGADAVLHIETTLCNETGQAVNCTIRTSILDPDGKVVGMEECSGRLDAFEKEAFTGSMQLKNAKLWDCENPNLYMAKTEVLVDGKPTDHYDTAFGIRTIEYTTDGLLLNGIPTPLYGACVHQDFAGVGVALPDAVQAYKIQRLKDMGLNAYRSSHNPATLELLDECDRQGMLVLNENRLIEVTRHRMEDLEELIKSSRNHPSVFAWSLSNEEMFAGSYQAKRILHTMLPFARRLDSTRPFVSAEAFLSPEEAEEYGLELFDILGLNYVESAMAGDLFTIAAQRYPQMKFMNTENTSWYSTRGIYEDNKLRGHCSSFGTRYVMMGGEGGPMAGGTARPTQTWHFYKDNPRTGGFFIWTGFDYRGEPTPLREYQVSSNFGVMDTCGFAKDDYYYYKSLFDRTPLVHIMPHWTWPIEGVIKTIRVYTNCEEIELLLNGESLGKKPLEADWVEYQVPYKSGRLEAVGYKAGKVVTSDVKETAGAPAKIILSVNREAINPDGKDVAFVTAQICDKDGTIVPDAENYVTFDVTGAGRLLGLGNGDPGSRENDKAGGRRAFSGLLMALIQSSGTQGGTITVSASSASLKGSVLTIRSE